MAADDYLTDDPYSKLYGQLPQMQSQTPAPIIATGNGAAPKGTTLSPWSTVDGTAAVAAQPTQPSVAADPNVQPTGGQLTDPAYVDKLIAWAAKQPGVNPSVINDPNYWKQAVASGRFKNDQAYLIQRFMQPEGAPEGSQTAPPLVPGGAAVGGSNFTPRAAFQPGARQPTPTSIFDSSNPLVAQGNSLYDHLMGVATGSIAESANPNLQIDPNDPIIKRQVDAYDAQNQLAQRRYLAGLAEKVGSNANTSAEARHAAEAGGQATGAFQGQLMQQELSARRQEIQSALNGAQGYLTSQQQLRLQEELAQIQSAEQQYEFDANLGERGYEFDTNQQYLNSPLAG